MFSPTARPTPVIKSARPIIASHTTSPLCHCRSHLLNLMAVFVAFLLLVCSQSTVTFATSIDGADNTDHIYRADRPSVEQTPECEDKFNGIVNFTEFNFPGNNTSNSVRFLIS